MTDRRQEQDRNAAWMAARRWQERARQARPSRGMSGPRLVLTWLLFGALMIVGTVIGLVFLLLGWLMLPFLRHRMKKRMERMRAEQARDVGGGVHREGRTPGEASPRESRGGAHDVLEGDYEVRGRDAGDQDRER